MSVEPTDAERRGDGQMNLATGRKGRVAVRVRGPGKLSGGVRKDGVGARRQGGVGSAAEAKGRRRPQLNCAKIGARRLGCEMHQAWATPKVGCPCCDDQSVWIFDERARRGSVVVRTLSIIVRADQGVLELAGW